MRLEIYLQATAGSQQHFILAKLMFAAVSAASLLLSPIAFAQQTGGTADEAKVMLMKAVAAVKADKAKALDMFTKGEGDGKIVALGNPNAKKNIGVDTRTLKDSTGKAFGAELYAASQKPEGEITEVSYMIPRPGPDKMPVPKVSLVTRVGDLGCGVGYYK